MSEEREPDGRAASDRRQFMGSASRVAMTAGLVGGYGGFGLIIGRYLYPARPGDRIWQYVAESDAIPAMPASPCHATGCPSKTACCSSRYR